MNTRSLGLFTHMSLLVRPLTSNARESRRFQCAIQVRYLGLEHVRYIYCLIIVHRGGASQHTQYLIYQRVRPLGASVLYVFRPPFDSLTDKVLVGMGKQIRQYNNGQPNSIILQPFPTYRSQMGMYQSSFFLRTSNRSLPAYIGVVNPICTCFPTVVKLQAPRV